MKHQCNIEQKLKRWYKKTTMENLTHVRTVLDKDIKIVNPPSKEDVQTFWNNIWGKEKQFNQEADWLPGLEKEYCMNVQPQKYEMAMEILSKK